MKTNESAKYVFISYSSKQQNYALSVEALLSKKQINTWMAPNDIPAGSTYVAVINQAIQNCSYFLLLLTNDAQNSVWVNMEVERAISYGKTVITLKLDDIQLNDSFSFYLSNSQIISAKEIDENTYGIRKILEAISSFVSDDDSDDIVDSDGSDVHTNDKAGINYDEVKVLLEKTYEAMVNYREAFRHPTQKEIEIQTDNLVAQFQKLYAYTESIFLTDEELFGKLSGIIEYYNLYAEAYNEWNKTKSDDKALTAENYFNTAIKMILVAIKDLA